MVRLFNVDASLFASLSELVAQPARERENCEKVIRVT
jgi:hypothetical protein